MPRKIKSSAQSTQQRKTSLRRAVGASKGPGDSARRSASEVPDGGKWAGSGRKTVERSQGPEIARQAQTGRGAKTRTVRRTNKVNHPNHG
jgi:hypothetical protein